MKIEIDIWVTVVTGGGDPFSVVHSDHSAFLAYAKTNGIDPILAHLSVQRPECPVEWTGAGGVSCYTHYKTLKLEVRGAP